MSEPNTATSATENRRSKNAKKKKKKGASSMSDKDVATKPQTKPPKQVPGLLRFPGSLAPEVKESFGAKIDLEEDALETELKNDEGAVESWETLDEDVVGAEQALAQLDLKHQKLLRRRKEEAELEKRRAEEEQARLELEAAERQAPMHAPPGAIKILRRPQSSGNLGLGNGTSILTEGTPGASGVPGDGKPKTLQERQSAYNEARKRILGSACPSTKEDGDVSVEDAIMSDPGPHHYSFVNNSANTSDATSSAEGSGGNSKNKRPAQQQSAPVAGAALTVVGSEDRAPQRYSQRRPPNYDGRNSSDGRFVMVTTTPPMVPVTAASGVAILPSYGRPPPSIAVAVSNPPPQMIQPAWVGVTSSQPPVFTPNVSVRYYDPSVRQTMPQQHPNYWSNR